MMEEIHQEAFVSGAVSELTGAGLVCKQDFILSAHKHNQITLFPVCHAPSYLVLKINFGSVGACIARDQTAGPCTG